MSWAAQGGGTRWTPLVGPRPNPIPKSQLWGPFEPPLCCFASPAQPHVAGEGVLALAQLAAGCRSADPALLSAPGRARHPQQIFHFTQKAEIKEVRIYLKRLFLA